MPSLSHAAPDTVRAAYLTVRTARLCPLDACHAERGMAHPLADCVYDPARFKRSYTFQEDRRWVGNAVEFKRIVATVAIRSRGSLRELRFDWAHRRFPHVGVLARGGGSAARVEARHEDFFVATRERAASN